MIPDSIVIADDSDAAAAVVTDCELTPRAHSKLAAATFFLLLILKLDILLDSVTDTLLKRLWSTNK